MTEPRYLPAANVRSLVFQGDALVDWVEGGWMYGLDGSERRPHRRYAYRFDAAVACPTGRLAVITERLGTKGLLLDATGQVIRELDRSYYHADDYLYPVALWRSPATGHSLLAHCPASYDRVEIDDLDTSARLTVSPDRSPTDWFHSRLQASPSGTRLLSAGWVWHPWDVVGWFDLERALADPTHLDTPRFAEGSLHIGLAEESSAAWQTDDTVLIGSSAEPEDPEEAEEAGDTLRLVSPGVAVVDVRTGRVLRSLSLTHPPGEVMPVGADRVLTLYEHPRLYHLDGPLLHAWPELATGVSVGSIQPCRPAPPAVALDPAGARFAVATPRGIAVVSLGG